MLNNSWNHNLWMKGFISRIQKRDSVRELRTEVFQSNLKLLEQGHYVVDGNSVNIAKCKITDSVFYDSPIEKLAATENQQATKIGVIHADCLEVAELMTQLGNKPVVLNMASSYHPGGGVLKGAGAQEENIFRRSNLYTALYQYVDYGEKYQVTRNPYFSYPLERNYGAIYSPNITIFRAAEHSGYKLLKKPFTTSILTVSAVRKPELFRENEMFRLQERDILRNQEKIRIMLRLAVNAQHDCLILSAFGCGAYGNPPEQVAQIFKTVFEEAEFKNKLKTILFAIIEDHNSRRKHNPNGNYLPFVEAFDNQ